MSVIPNDVGLSDDPPIASALDTGDIDSDLEDLPSPSTAGTQSSAASTSTEDDHYASEADRQWRESLQQLELVLTMVLVPYLGKYFGRRCAYWGKLDVLANYGIMSKLRPRAYSIIGWAKYMEWQYPVSVEITNKGLFRASGVVEAASSL